MRSLQRRRLARAPAREIPRELRPGRASDQTAQPSADSTKVTRYSTGPRGTRPTGRVKEQAAAGALPPREKGPMRLAKSSCSPLRRVKNNITWPDLLRPILCSFT